VVLSSSQTVKFLFEFYTQQLFFYPEVYRRKESHKQFLKISCMMSSNQNMKQICRLNRSMDKTFSKK
jgi:hypothetical protein